MSGASPEGARSSDERRDGAAAPGPASSATPLPLLPPPLPPPPSESGRPPGTPRRRAQGWGGTRRGKSWENWGPARTRLHGQGRRGRQRVEEGRGARARGAAAGSGPLPGALMAAGLGEGGPERLAGAAGPPAPSEGRLAVRLGVPGRAAPSPEEPSWATGRGREVGTRGCSRTAEPQAPLCRGVGSSGDHLHESPLPGCGPAAWPLARRVPWL